MEVFRILAILITVDVLGFILPLIYWLIASWETSDSTAREVKDLFLDLTSFDTSNVTNMYHMFYNSGVSEVTIGQY